MQRILSAAIISSILLATAGPVFAADPTTKADCEKAKGTWDEKTGKCTVKK